MLQYPSMSRYGIVSSLLLALVLFGAPSQGKPTQSNAMIRFSSLTVTESGLFELAGLPENDLPAEGKGGVQSTGEVSEIFVNPLKFNGGVVSPVTPIRSVGGLSQTTSTGLQIQQSALRFGGVKPSACKIPGLGIRAVICGAKITNVNIILGSTFESGATLNFLISPSTTPQQPSELIFANDPSVDVCDRPELQPIVIRKNPCTINLSLALLQQQKSIFSGVGSIQ